MPLLGERSTVEQPLELRPQTRPLADPQPTTVVESPTTIPPVAEAPAVGDRHTLAAHGNGRATAAMAFVSEIPVAAALHTAGQFNDAAQFVIGHHQAPTGIVNMQIAPGLTVAVDGPKGQVAVAASLDPAAFVAAVDSGTLHIDAPDP